MPEWLIERGLGETRAVLVEAGEIAEARIEVEGIVRAGTVLAAHLADAGSNGRNAVAVAENGSEFILPRGASRATLGAAVIIEVRREAIPGSEPWKRPLAGVATETPGAPPALTGSELPFPSSTDRLAEAGWNDVIEEARSGVVTFAGGELRISPTPAMTLIDVDGYLPPEDLARAGAAAAARAIRRLDIGGSIGIDLPTSGSKAARQDAGAAIDAVLPQPFERTAVNGFGFVQIVRPRLRASLVELAQDRASFEARALLRRVALEPAGGKRIVAHPAVAKVIEDHKDWVERLARHVGGTIELRGDGALPISGGYAENR